MVLSAEDFSVWTNIDSGELFDRSRSFRIRDHLNSESAATLAKAVLSFRQALTESAPVLEGAASFRKTNESDPTLRGLESIEDDQLLRLVDKLATTSSINQGWAEEIETTISRFRSFEAMYPRVWNDDAESVVQELEKHLDNLKWASTTLRNWSNQVGNEYDRRHPERRPLPFTPIDIGPTDSSRLPPVL